MYYKIVDGKIVGTYGTSQSFPTVYIADPRPSKLHQPTFDGAENFTGWVLDAEAWLAATKAEYEAAVERHLDAVAQASGYNTIYTALSYKLSGNPVWAAESAALSDWRDAVWQHVFVLYQDVAQGNTELPTIEAVIAALPEYEFEYTEE